MTPLSNTKSISALLVIFFLAVASSEASRGVNPAAAVTDMDDLFSSAVLGQHASLRGYKNPYGNPNQVMNITVKCMLSILDFMTCLDYFTDETIPAPPKICCDGYVALSKSPACLCQVLNVGWVRRLPKPTYLPHVFDAPVLCGVEPSTTPFPSCDAFMPPVPSPAPAPVPSAASPATPPSSAMS